MKYLKIYESFKEVSLRDYIINKDIQPDRDRLNCGNLDLTNLKGIEFFPNLKDFDCYNNKLTSLKGIEICTELRGLSCTYNMLTSLKGIENLIHLNYLACTRNKLKNLDEIENLPELNRVLCNGNNWEYPLPNKYIKKFEINYSLKEIKKFKTYESQKEFLTKYPERIDDLKSFGIHEKIKEEFADIIEGSEFGFFSLKN